VVLQEKEKVKGVVEEVLLGILVPLKEKLLHVGEEVEEMIVALLREHLLIPLFLKKEEVFGIK
jgi:hypothetical protein